MNKAKIQFILEKMLFVILITLMMISLFPPLSSLIDIETGNIFIFIIIVLFLIIFVFNLLKILKKWFSGKSPYPGWIATPISFVSIYLLDLSLHKTIPVIIGPLFGVSIFIADMVISYKYNFKN